ncbi:hypothetical protein LCGC14_0469700 [marine sediment metagenome]|uniref:Smr domain-containing protein n=1 Tax=marine sediment metagenome TaxID=412755 RepID=A0A0F9SCM9_9ZZZZ
MSVVKIDLHGIKHEDVRGVLIAEIEEHWNDDPSPDFVVVTGHSDQMREIVKEVASEYRFLAEKGLCGAYLYLTF